jgi:hypothetical protein
MSAFGVDVYRPTELCEIMTRNQSDKGNLHNYTTVYDKLFSKRRSDQIRLFEMGLGTNNEDVPSNMGRYGRPGASLYGWREYFPNGTIYGGDVDRRILFTSDRINTYYCDQTDPKAIRDMWSEPSLSGLFDIIIDDGLHTFAANECLIENSLHKLAPGGVYIVEDIRLSDIPLFEAKLPEWKAKYPYTFQLVKLPPAVYENDNNLLIVTKSVHVVKTLDDIDISPVTTPVKYHLVWFGRPLDQHVLCLSSLFATQANPDVTLWTTDEWVEPLRAHLTPLFKDRAFKVEVFRSVHEGVLYPKEPIDKFWTCDDWRLDILYTYGGIYADLDNLFLKDISWISRYPAMSQWGSDPRCNSSIASFTAGHPELRKLIDIMASIPNRKGWGRAVPNFEWSMNISLYCFSGKFFDSGWEHNGIGTDSFFDGMPTETETFRNSFVYHWHNKWDRDVRNPNTLVGQYWKKFTQSS